MCLTWRVTVCSRATSPCRGPGRWRPPAGCSRTRRRDIRTPQFCHWMICSAKNKQQVTSGSRWSWKEYSHNKKSVEDKQVPTFSIYYSRYCVIRAQTIFIPNIIDQLFSRWRAVAWSFLTFICGNIWKISIVESSWKFDITDGGRSLLHYCVVRRPQLPARPNLLLEKTLKVSEPRANDGELDWTMYWSF